MPDKQTCLYDRHVRMGAKMVSFGGFCMPIQYTTILEEHNAVRHAVGVFDVSHMGEVLVEGRDAVAFVQHIFTGDIAAIPDGKIVYGMMLHPTGGTIDDLLVYRLKADNFLLVINAANIGKDVAHIEQEARAFSVTIENLSERCGQLAIQGPEAERTVEQVLGLKCAELVFYTFKTMEVEGQQIIVSRTGYTGEDGFELYASTALTCRMWDKLIEAGVTPCGLGCRDTLRFEVGLPLYGDELTDELTPLEAGLSMFVKLDKGPFIGREPLMKQKAEGLTRRIVGIELDDKAPARHGYEVEHEGRVVGYVTTGYLAPSTGKSVCMALVNIEAAKLGTRLDVRIHRRLHAGTVVKKRFYQKNYKK